MKSLLPIIAIAAIALFFVMVATGPGSRVGQGWQYLTNGPAPINNGNSAHAEGSSIVGGPSLSASKIDSILSSAGSPAAGTGNAFTLDSAEYNIDDAFALAIFKHESGYGTAGIAVQTKSLGNIRCTDGYSCIGGFRSYPSWQDGITDWYKLMASSAYVGGGLTTLSQIIPKYAPASENDPSAYIAAVESDVTSWRTV